VDPKALLTQGGGLPVVEQAKLLSMWHAQQQQGQMGMPVVPMGMHGLPVMTAMTGFEQGLAPFLMQGVQGMQGMPPAHMMAAMQGIPMRMASKPLSTPPTGAVGHEGAFSVFHGIQPHPGMVGFHAMDAMAPSQLPTGMVSASMQAPMHAAAGRQIMQEDVAMMAGSTNDNNERRAKKVRREEPHPPGAVCQVPGADLGMLLQASRDPGVNLWGSVNANGSRS